MTDDTLPLDRRVGARLSGLSTPFIVTLITSFLIFGWLLLPLLGDASPLQAYWLVLPAVIAAARFGLVAAVCTSMAGWIAAGPLTSVLPGAVAVPAELWWGQGVFLFVVSIAVALLVRRVKRADRQLMALLQERAEEATAAANDRQALTNELQRRINQDVLTGLANRSAFVARLEHELRFAGRELAVLFVDLDDFKTVNNTLGHAVGDELIVAVAKRLCAGSRGSDVVARFGGDEFAVLLVDVDEETALAAAARILGQLKKPFNLCGRTVAVRASGGLALPSSAPSGLPAQVALELLKHADLAMYASKVQRTRGVTVFHENMQSEMRDRLALESDMNRALADSQFYLDYQPIVDMRDGHVRSVEALLRWDHPGRGQISPAVFIPVAEQTGMIVPLTLWVVRNACAQLRAWDSDPTTEGLAVAINISGRVVVEPGVGAAVARELHHAGISPRRVILEITESLLMEDRGVAVQTLCQLRALGMRLSVDDFGTGYSSLSRLNTLPIDEVKIDQSFVHQLDTDAGRTIVAASIAMAHGLGLRVVAEGVETETQMHQLERAGCDDAQGYFFSRPLSAVGIAAHLAQRLRQREAATVREMPRPRPQSPLYINANR